MPHSASPSVLRLVAPALAVVSIALGALPGAVAAAPPLAPSVIGEPPNGGGVFRFPQAVTVTPGGSTVFVGDQYSGVVQAFDAGGAPKFTIGARAVRRETGRLGIVGGVATDRSGHLYVLDSENDRVQMFDTADGRWRAAFGDNTMFHLVGGDPSTGAGISASGIAVTQSSPSASPVVYVADQGNDRVARFTLDPSTLAVTGGPQFSSPSVGLAAPQGLALDPAGTRLYVADDDNHRVVVLDPTTLAPVAQAGTFGTGAGQFQNPYDVAVDSHDPAQLYVADNLNNRVDVFDAGSLGFLGTFGHAGYGAGTGNMQIIRSVGALTDVPGGGVDVADTANNRIQAFDAGGKVVAAWGLAGRGFGYVTRPRGVALGPGGAIAVADSFDQRIELFNADGTYAGQRGLISASTGFATQGALAGQFSLPGGVAYDGSGNLWVADTGNGSVVALDPGGAILRTTRGLSRPSAVAPSAAGTYVADTGNNRVVLIAPDDTVTQVGPARSAPVAVAVTAAGTPYVADDTSVRDALTGAAVSGPNGTTWDHPTGLAFDAGGSLYVSERRGTPDGARVVRGTPVSGGGFTWDTIATEGAGDGRVIEPGGVSVSADGGTLLVADTGNNRVVRFDAPGHAPPATATLTTSVNDLTLGTLVSDAPGIACPTDCRQRLSQGQQVTLTARAVAGSVVTGWTGACAPAGASATCTVTMNGDQSAGATFGAAPPQAPPPAPPPPPPVSIASVRLSTHTLHRARKADRRRHRRAQRETRATVTVVLSRAASVTATVQQGRPGRRQGSACTAPSRANRRGRPCTRFVTMRRKRTLNAATTTLRFTLTPSFGGGPLAPGAYRLAVTALDAQGNRVGPVTPAFRVTR